MIYTVRIIVVLYIIIVNLLGFISMGLDKHKAKKNQWRIQEKTLFVIAAIGGSIGSIIGMQYFRHKTKHFYFVIGMPLILVLQVILCYVFAKYFIL